MKLLRDLLALVGLATLVLAGYYYYAAYKNPIEVVVIQGFGLPSKKHNDKDKSTDGTDKSDDKHKSTDGTDKDDSLTGAEAGLELGAEAL